MFESNLAKFYLGVLLLLASSGMDGAYLDSTISNGTSHPMRASCSALALNSSHDHIDRYGQFASGCCISEQYDFAYMRAAAKMAGTTVQKSYLLPSFCDVLFNSHGHGHGQQLFGGATIPTGCESYLQHHGFLDCTCNTTIQRLSTIGSTFINVRNPFARFISIYKYVLENWSFRHKNQKYVGISKFLELFSGPKRFTVDIFFDHEAGSGHWYSQMLHVFSICKYLPNTALIPLEPDVLQNLAPVVQSINSRRNPELPAMMDPQKYSSRNRMSYACPWQCYYELCQKPCFDFVSKEYDLDIMALDSIGIYPAPHTVADLWLDSQDLNASWLTIPNRTRACLQVCQ